MEYERKRIKFAGNSEESRSSKATSQPRQRRGEEPEATTNELLQSSGHRPRTSAFETPKKYRPNEDKLRMIHNSTMMGKVNTSNFAFSMLFFK